MLPFNDSNSSYFPASMTSGLLSDMIIVLKSFPSHLQMQWWDVGIENNTRSVFHMRHISARSECSNYHICFWMEELYRLLKITKRE